MKCMVCEKWSSSAGQTDGTPEVKDATVMIHRKGGKPPVPMCSAHSEDAKRGSPDLIEKVEPIQA